MICPDCYNSMTHTIIPVEGDLTKFFKCENIIEYVCPFCGTVKWEPIPDKPERVIFT